MHDPGDDADLVLSGGRVRTLEAGRPPAEALWIRGGRIAAAGTDDEILSAAPAGARRIALEGACVCRAWWTPTSTSRASPSA